MKQLKKNLKSLVSQKMAKGGSAPMGMDTDSMVEYKNNYLKNYLAQNAFSAIADEELDNLIGGLTEMANAYGFAEGGIHLNPDNKGKFTAQAKGHDMGVQEFANYVMNNKDNFSSATVKRANFARNAKKFKHAEGGDVDASFIEWYSQYTPEGQEGIDYSEDLPYDYYSYYQNHVLSGEVAEVVPELISQYANNEQQQEFVAESEEGVQSVPMMANGGPSPVGNVSDFVQKYNELLARGEGDSERIGNTFRTAIHKLNNPVYTVQNAETKFKDPSMQSLWEEYNRDFNSVAKNNMFQNGGEGTKPKFQDKGEVTNKTVPTEDEEFNRIKGYFDRYLKENNPFQNQWQQYANGIMLNNNTGAPYIPVTRQVYSGSYAPANWSWLTGRQQPQGKWFNILPYNVANTTPKQMVEERNWLGRPKRITTTFEHRGNDNGFMEWLKQRQQTNTPAAAFPQASTNTVPSMNFPASINPNNTPIIGIDAPLPNNNPSPYYVPQIPTAANGMNVPQNPFGINGVLSGVDYKQVYNTGQPNNEPFATTDVTYKAHNPFDVSNYADWGLAGMSAISNIGESLEMARLQQQINERMTGDALVPAVGAGDVSRGTWTTNQGYFRPNQHTPVQFAGFNAGRIGGGGQYQEGGEYEMTDAEIAEFIKRGGKIEYL